MQAVKLCSNQILQFLTGGWWLTQVVLFNGRKTVAVEVLLLVAGFVIHRLPVQALVAQTRAALQHCSIAIRGSTLSTCDAIDSLTASGLTPQLYDWSVSSEHLGFYF